MSIEELLGKYMRLRQELAEAYSATRWRARYIERLAEDIAEAGRAVRRSQPLDEQTDEVLPGI